MSPVIGIDLGTTNSAAAVVTGGEPMVIPIREEAVTLPSVVAIVGGNRLVGEAAQRQLVSNSKNTVTAAKRFMGRHFDDPETQRALDSVGYECVKGPNGDVWVLAGGRRWAIQEIGAIVLEEIKRAAVAHLAEDVTEAVIAVPAYFNDRQRHATRQAAKIAGLEVSRVINEPTAAALAYGLHQGGNRKVAVYDLGGGTFDVSILRVGGGAIEVLASAGDAFLGGHDFDQRIFGWLTDKIAADVGVYLDHDATTLQRLREAAEGAKLRLSDQSVAKIALPFLTVDAAGTPIHFECELTRAEYEGLVADLIERTLSTFSETLREAKIAADDLDELLLVGGMTRTPVIRRRVQEMTGCEPAVAVHPDLVVAVGAAVQGAILTDDTMSAVLLDVTPHNLGVLTVAELAETMIPRNTKLPAATVRRFTTATDDQPTVKIVVYQGDSRHIGQNEVLGQFHLEGLRPAPRGEVEIDVRFNISAEGIVEVSATNVETGEAERIRISGALGLPDTELDAISDDHRQNPPSSST